MNKEVKKENLFGEFLFNYSVVNKQLNDKERVAAALENPSLLNVVNQCIAHSDSDIYSRFNRLIQLELHENMEEK